MLALVEFALNGAQSAQRDNSWPFGDAFELFDTAASPYPPQGIAPQHDDVLLTPANAFGETPRDDLPFAIACRNESWQRLFGALSDVRRRNLRSAHPRAHAPLFGPHLVLDSLTAETEPCFDQVSFLGRTTFHDRDGRVSPCLTPLAVKCHVAALLCAVSDLLGPATAACIHDPIEGDILGYAPPLALRRDAPIDLKDASA